MKIATVALVCAPLLLTLGCGAGSMTSGGGGGGTNPAPESGVIFKTTNGPFSVAMSTSFQPAEWDSQLLTLNPSAITMLGSLGPHHIRLQGTRREYRADLGYGLIILRPRPELGNLKMSITTYGK